MKISPETPKIL